MCVKIFKHWLAFSSSVRLRYFSLGKIILGDPGAVSQGPEKRRDESFQAQAKKPLGTDSHRTISKRSSECWPLLGTKKALYYCAQSASPGHNQIWRIYDDVTHICKMAPRRETRGKVTSRLFAVPRMYYFESCDFRQWEIRGVKKKCRPMNVCAFLGGKTTEHEKTDID